MGRLRRFRPHAQPIPSNSHALCDRFGRSPRYGQPRMQNTPAGGPTGVFWYREIA